MPTPSRPRPRSPWTTCGALIFELRPGGLVEKGLIGSVAAWVEAVGARTGLAVTFHSDLEFVALPAGMEDDLYRIVQEALHNVDKHARATAVTVRIAVRGAGRGVLVVDIEDDGVGFHRPPPARSDGPQSDGPPSDGPQSDGPLSDGQQSLGLQSMRERAQRWGGSVVLRSRAGQGGHVRLTIPLPPMPGPPPSGRSGEPL